MNPEPFAALTLARIVRPWGRRGEVAAEILTDFPKRLTNLREAWLSDGRNPARQVRIRACRVHIGQAVIHFAGVESISDAELLRGLEVQVPLSERMPLEPGRYYISDLVGCTVWEHTGDSSVPGAEVGKVSDVQQIGDKPGDKPSVAAVESWVLSVTTPQGELLVPLASEICTLIDVEARRIEVRLPEGLRSLNQG